MPSQDDTPTSKARPNTTDPIFPPRLGASAPVVSVTAVQGPGLNKRLPRAADGGTTERLLTGLVATPLDPNDANTRGRARRTRGAGGEETAAYGTVRQPAGASYRGENAVLGAPSSSSMNTTLDAPAERDPRRDERTVMLPRGDDRWIAVASFLISGLVVWAGGWIYLQVKLHRRAAVATEVAPTEATIPAPAQPAPAETVPPQMETPVPEIVLPVPTAEAVVTSEPVIESQMVKRSGGPRAAAPARPRASAPSASIASAAPRASAAPSAPIASAVPRAREVAGPEHVPPPDFDELRKSITH